MSAPPNGTMISAHHWLAADQIAGLDEDLFLARFDVLAVDADRLDVRYNVSNP
jgi:hypothetical protein